MSLRNLIALSACSVSSVTSSNTVCSLVAALAVRQRDQKSGALVEEVVNPFQFTGQQIVVMTKFKQLRVGVLQQLNRGLRPGGVS